MPSLPPRKNLLHIYPAELKRKSSRRGFSARRNQPPMQMANVGVSVPLPGISSGGSYVHLSWASHHDAADAGSKRLQAGSLDGEILLLC